MRVLLDTCVVLDYLQAREPFFDDALNIMIGISNREYEGFITASSVTDLYYIIHKSLHSDKDSRKYLSMLTQLVGILDTRSEDCINALHSSTSDYEDAVMIETAARSKVDYIVTRNTRDYASSGMPVITPSDFLMTQLN